MQHQILRYQLDQLSRLTLYDNSAYDRDMGDTYNCPVCRCLHKTECTMVSALAFYMHITYPDPPS